MMFGSANRDERKWGDPERFDISREPLDHVAFGYGVHGCAGIELARIEGRCLLAALARRVRRFEVGAPTWRVNNVLRGIASLPTTIVPA
jgi:cytochrome P450